MKDWLTEWIVVFAHSSRAQVAVVVGIVGALLIWVAGRLVVADISFDGYLAPMADVFRIYVSDRYNGIALLVLFGAFAAAIRYMKKDRKRLFKL
jgi:hypothetical protein